MIGLGLSVVQIAVRQLLGFDPKSLFAAGEPGVWYDPSDFSTMFQDSAGTTPVTAVEQPVGLILDKSKGLVLGPELVTNGDFSDGTTGWTLASGASLVGGAIQAVSIAQFANIVQQSLSLVSGRRYAITYTISEYVSGAVVPRFTVGSNASGTTRNSNGTFTEYFLSGGTATFGIQATIAGTSLTIDNISVRELPGNHAIQTTSTSRPVLSARYNLLTATATLATKTVTTRATTQTLRFEGAGTVTLSGTATGTYSAGSHSITTTAGNLTLTVSGTVTKADLRAANMGIGLPAYQRVNTATDYDTAGFPHYLRFDGVDDFLVTNSINFTATDKMTVFAGVRKLSEDARGIVSELSTSTVANNGTFLLAAPETSVSADSYGFFSKGSTPIGVVGTVYAAPITNVLAGIGDISGDQAILRINGAQAASSTTDQGTGNYGNYPLYIGRRGGTTLPFNGHLYSLIVRGAQSNAGQIASAETWVAGKTGITL